MVGIPHFLNTQRDVENLQKIAVENLIERKEWIKKLEELKNKSTFQIPIIEKGENYFIIPKIDRELPAIYHAVLSTLEEQTEQEVEVYKIVATPPDKDFIELTGGALELDRLGITEQEINEFIKELL